MGASVDGKKQAEEKIKAGLARCCLGTSYGHATGPVNPPMSRACGVCPPCPASCNPNAPPTVAEKEVKKLTKQLHQTEENFKLKVTECALLRSELMKKKEELEKERCMHKEAVNKLRNMELRFEGLKTSANAMLGTKEQELDQEVNVRTLRASYKEARDEIDELRILIKEQNEQLQDYRVKFLEATQLAEGQKKQIDLLALDNSRISEQINLEVQRVKLKFQEKLLELSPIPDLLKATQMRLKDAQQSQALAEHNAEQLARELICAREKVHVLLHAATKPPEKPDVRGIDEKQIQMLQTRLSQLTETNATLRTEIERLKANVVRVEEQALLNTRRLQEKMHECAQLGSELERTRDEAAKAIARVTERIDINRKCLQTTIAELERQLAAARARVKTTEKEREEIQCRMSCQIKRLNENFEQAQLRIMSLSAQILTLRRSPSEGQQLQDTVAGGGECMCKTLFSNP
ncbi:hypothetical protein O0L34_g2386 [Tuta absoluta]|nr:hypothetical protein O0L34_g2386 [Tuta absoluta]